MSETCEDDVAIEIVRVFRDHPETTTDKMKKIWDSWDDSSKAPWRRAARNVLNIIKKEEDE